MIKVYNNVASREALPSFLIGLAPESLANLSWTDPQLGVHACAWWPEEIEPAELPAGMQWGAETLTPDAARQVVVVTRHAVPLSSAELAAQAAAARPAFTDQNNAAYEAAIAQLTADYPAAEIQTWERQRAEVVAWAANPAAPTPWIDQAAAARGLNRNEYLTRTLAKVAAFAAASAWLTGRRQGIDDAIRAASSLAALHAIVIDYSAAQAAQ